METEGVDSSAIEHVDLFRLIDLLRQRVVEIHVNRKIVKCISAFPDGRVIHHGIGHITYFDVGTSTIYASVSRPSGEIIGVRIRVITALQNDTIGFIGGVEIAIGVTGGVLVHGHHQVAGAVVFERHIQGDGVPAFGYGPIPFIHHIGGAYGFKIGATGKSAPRHLFQIEGDMVGLWRTWLHIETDSMDGAASGYPDLLSGIELLHKGIGIITMIGCNGPVAVIARSDSNFLAVRCDVEPEIGAISIRVLIATPGGEVVEVGLLVVAVPGNCSCTCSGGCIKGIRSARIITADGVEHTDEQVAAVIRERPIKSEGDPTVASGRHIAVIYHVVEANGHHVSIGIKRALGCVHQEDLDVT